MFDARLLEGSLQPLEKSNENNQAYKLGFCTTSYISTGDTGAAGAAAPVALVVRGSAGTAKCSFQKIHFQVILDHINIQMEASCFSSAVTIIEQFLLLSRSQCVRGRCLAPYDKRPFPICFNSIL